MFSNKPSNSDQVKRMPQIEARRISNIYVMREPPAPIRKSSFHETTVEVLVAEAYKDKKRALAYLGAAERILDKLNNPAFIAEYKKKIENCRMQILTQSELQSEPFFPPRIAKPKQQETSKPEDVLVEGFGKSIEPPLKLMPVPA